MGCTNHFPSAGPLTIRVNGPADEPVHKKPYKENTGIKHHTCNINTLARKHYKTTVT